jgi:hypothetical protein
LERNKLGLENDWPETSTTSKAAAAIIMNKTYEKYL